MFDKVLKEIFKDINFDNVYNYKSIKTNNIYPNDIAAKQIVNSQRNIDNYTNRDLCMDFLIYSLEFLISANELLEKGWQLLKKYIIHKNSYLCSINYFCLSIELLLKAIIFNYSEKEETEIKLSHNLETLYRDIPNKYKDEKIEKFIIELKDVYGIYGDRTRYPISIKDKENNCYKYYPIDSYKIDPYTLKNNTAQLFYKYLHLLGEDKFEELKYKFEIKSGHI